MAETSPPDADEDLRLLADSIATLLERAGGVARARSLRSSAESWDGAVLREMADGEALRVLAPESGAASAWARPRPVCWRPSRWWGWWRSRPGYWRGCAPITRCWGN